MKRVIVGVLLLAYVVVNSGCAVVCFLAGAGVATTAMAVSKEQKEDDVK